MNLWLLIGLLALLTLALKTAGPITAGGWEPPAWAQRVIALFGPTLMAALIVSNTFVTDRQLVIDERATGLAVGLLALLLRAPLLLACLLGAAACAVARSLG